MTSFILCDVEYQNDEQETLTLGEILDKDMRLVKSSSVSNGVLTAALFDNGFVGSAVKAYNDHYHLILTPDQVWLSITTALSNYINHNDMEGVFTDGKMELNIIGSGTIETTDWDALVDQMGDKINKNIKSDMLGFIECDFSTTDKTTRTVSKLVLMGAMQKFFKYKFTLKCGIPKVTLKGTKNDWIKIKEKIKFMLTFKKEQLTNWVKCLDFTLDNFIKAFDNDIDGFWNRIALAEEQASGPKYLQGWILAFAPWDEDGKYVLRNAADIKMDNIYGKLDTQNVASSSVEIWIEIDDGKKHDALFVAGLIGSIVNGSSITPSVDYALYLKN